ncbi:MFS transporter [Paenibacillus sp. NPDC057934]|uniref:MFS transporter n=1 Tax=Paenibacillus sp. NPDC057934 TaxID=3346282 RepID=UPI0036D797C7
MNKKFKTAVLSLAVTSTLAPMLAAPAVKLLMMDFPDASSTLVQSIVTFPSFFIIPALLIVSLLSRFLSKKVILVIGLILYTIGGVGPAAMNSIVGILILRGVLGLSIGFLTPTMNALIAEYFVGDERLRMNGLTTAINGIGGAFFLLVGGTITAFGWRGVFFTYAYGLVLLVLVILFVPATKPSRTASSVQKDQKKKAASLSIGVVSVGLSATALMILYYTVPTNLAAFIIDNGYGNSATSGYMTAISFTFVFLAGISGARLKNLLLRAFVPIVVLILGLGALLMGTASSLWAVAASVGLIGFGFGLAYPVLLSRVASAAKPESVTLAVSSLTAFANIGQFITPYVTKGIEMAFRLNSIRGVFLVLAVVLGILLFWTAVKGFRTTKRSNPLGT